MNKENIPRQLHHLIPLVEKWGIEDDGFRDEIIATSSVEDIKNLVYSMSEEDFIVLNEWFCKPIVGTKETDEYIKFSVFFMAYEYAKSQLEFRNA